MNNKIKSDNIKKLRVSSLASIHLSHGDLISKLCGLYYNFSYKKLYEKNVKGFFDE